MNTRVVLNVAMALVIIFAMSYRVTGNIGHELSGMAALILFVAHNVINWKWYLSLSKGKYDISRILRTALNFLILLMFIVLVVNGMFLSRMFFPFIDAGESMLPKRLHTFAAYWLFILISLHIGLHWGRVLVVLKSFFDNKRIFVMRAAAIIAAIGGVYASFSRDIGARLIMYYSFDFLDPNKPAIVFIVSNFAIMGLYIFVAYNAFNFFFRFRTKRHGDSVVMIVEKDE